MKIGDLIIILGALGLIRLAFNPAVNTNLHSEWAEISSVSGHRQILSLSQDQRLAINGPLGDSQIEIKDGKIRFASSPCPFQYCTHSGWLHYDGQFAACLPNQISITLGSPNTGFDAVTL